MDLTDLSERLKRAKAEQEAPPPPGGSKRILPLDHYLNDEDHRVARQAVRALRIRHPDAFNLYTEGTIALLVMERLAERDGVPLLEELADEVAQLSAEEGPWLVSTPLANIVIPEAAIQLSEDAVLWRAVLSMEWMDEPRQ